jgi:sugar lactone lactonase YvrE
MKKQKKTSIIYFVAVMIFLWSCEKTTENIGGEPYNPSLPVKIDSFEPDSGGMATKVFIYGSNFGTDLSKIKVYFNTMRAPVVGSDGSHIYVITPRQPGEECILSVVVENDSVAYTQKKYRYRTMTTVTTITGKKGTTEFMGGTLSEATFHNPSTLCVDAEGNIFLTHWRQPYCFVLINQEKDIVQALYTGDPLGAPTADADGKVIMAPTDGGDGYYSFDPDAQWAAKSRLILHPNEDQVATGMKDFSINWKHGMSACFEDECIYTRSYNGQIVKFNPLTRTGELVATNIQPNDDSYPYFDPYQTNILYISYPSRHAIYTFDIKTGEHTLFAGSAGTSGWRDGNRLECEFNTPSQLVVDRDGSVYVADRGNHCIRRITPDGMVTTIIGKGGIAGYQDGNPEDALFNNPRGVAIDKEGNIYVADYENNVVRKLAVE